MTVAVRRTLLALGFIVAALLFFALGIVAYVVGATRTGVANMSGTQTGLGTDGPITIARDGRGIPHVRATTDRDLFFAEGYAMAQDRLFQMDLTRRYTEGRLAEILGAPLAQTDRGMRAYALDALASAGYARAAPSERALFDAFAAGVNAAAAREPVPPEYRVLFTRFEPWRPQDAIVVGYATLLDLDDDAASIIPRDAIHRSLGMAGTNFYLPLTDPVYDVPTNGDPKGQIAKLPDRPGATTALPRTPKVFAAIDDRTTLGSNGWAAGADRTSVHRAILSNDPHLSLRIPGVWWLFEGRSPGFHIAGAVLAGTVGVTLGHNGHVAWGVTAGETSAMRLLREPFRGSDEVQEHGRWVHAAHHPQAVGVRFGHPLTFDVLTTANGTIIAHDATRAYLRDWLGARTTEDLFGPYLALDRSDSVEAAIAAVRRMPEPALNVIAADDRGRATYHLAGGIPADGVWGRWAVDGDTPEPSLIPFDRLPQIGPARGVLVITSNNRAAGAGSLRLAPFWPSPYRAFEIRRILASAARENGGLLTPEALAAPQRDDGSPAERELARLVVAAADRAGVQSDATLTSALADLRAFDGMITGDSRAATLVNALRLQMYARLTAAFTPDVAREYISSSATLTVPLRALRERPRGWVPDWDRFAIDSLRAAVAAVGTPTPPYGVWGAQPLVHPLAAFGLSLWNGPTMPGRGGAYAPAVQNRGHGQSFRAEWIAGDWDAGTIDVDAGESGEPGSPHYADRTAGWERFERTPLPFSDTAVAAAAQTTLTLQP